MCGERGTLEKKLCEYKNATLEGFRTSILRRNIYILFLICKVFIVNYNTVDLITCEVLDSLRVMKIN